MSLVIVLSDNAVASMRATGSFPSDMLGREVFIHDTRDVYIETGEDIHPGMTISEADKLDQAYYTAMAQLEQQNQIAASQTHPTVMESPRNLRIYWE